MAKLKASEIGDLDVLPQGIGRSFLRRNPSVLNSFPNASYKVLMEEEFLSSRFAVRELLRILGSEEILDCVFALVYSFFIMQDTFRTIHFRSFLHAQTKSH